MYSAFRFIQLEIVKICQSNPDTYDFPDLVTATQTSDFTKGIWGFEFPDQVKDYVAEEMGDTYYDSFCCLLRAIIFARYLNDRVAITVVTAGNEDDAFDMFEALNTTGEPLTAFETFKPKVIECETISKYEHSPSREFITQIEKYLDRYKKADNKQKATSEMLVPFALAETGKKLQKKLNQQRRYLRDEFKKLSDLHDIDKNRDFVKSIASVATFMRHGWNVQKGSDPTFEPLTVNNQEALVGFEVLRKLNHSITIAPLSRFYQHASDATTDVDYKRRTEEFSTAIKATVAFSILWRGAKGGTANIDSHYREIMRNGKNINGEKIPPLARRPNGKSGALSLTNYRRALQLILEEESLHTKKKWIERVCKMPVYDHSSVLARFLLFCASDDAVLDHTEQGLIQRGRPDHSPMLELDIWNNHKYFTVEHIAPQSQSNDWRSDRYDDIYNDPDTIHTLGNLILLPGDANSVVSDKDWEYKRRIYQLLSSDTSKEFDDFMKRLVEDGITLNQTGANVLKNAKYLGICKSVAVVDKWSLEIIQKRTKCLAELAWDRLKPWLFP